VLVLPRFFGALGVQLAQPVTDAITTLIAIPLARGVLNDLAAQEAAERTSE
jgi:hypothetical protein